MPFRFDTEEEYETRRSRGSRAANGKAGGSDTEIALGTRSLLAIFFGLVLICAIFFGLGYSVGRGSGTRAAAASSPDTTSAAPDSHLSKPSADQSLTPVETPSTVATDSGTPASDTSAAQPAQAAPTSAAPPSPSASTPSPVRTAQSPAAAPATPAAKPATLEPAAATLPNSFMVQVAAVRVPQDAQILVEALKKHGYAASVRNEPQDQLLHIQLGPYPSRADAMAMRTKLLSDGYNAVVK